MVTVREIAAEILRREGGYVNDPDDPGGPTNFGVTLATLRAVGRDVTGDGRVDLADLKALTRAQAEEIFLRHYFYVPGLDALPEVLQASVFDMQVNAGSNAIRILQELLNRLGAGLKVDGALGPQTLEAARRASAQAPDLISDAYGIARRNYYYRLADKRPASRKYCRRKDGGKGGWITRAEEFISPRFHLSAAQHRERMASWG